MRPFVLHKFVKRKPVRITFTRLLASEVSQQEPRAPQIEQNCD